MAERFIVLKFGGTSVSTRERWDTIGKEAAARAAEGYRTVVVCSALSGISNALEALLQAAVSGPYEPLLDAIREKHRAIARDMGLDADAVLRPWFEEVSRIAQGVSLLRDVGPRIKARAMAMGELMSTALGAAYLSGRGLPVTWRDARELLTSVREPALSESRRYLAASCSSAADPELAARLAQGQDIILTQGFIARDASGETVLLGRGGSDTSASYFAAKLLAERLEIWTDVPGMFTANPRKVPDARLLLRLGYEEAQELATMGASVLQPRCIEPVRRHGIPLLIRWTQYPEREGTVISADVPGGGAEVKAVSDKRNLVLVSMDTVGMWQTVGFLADVFAIYKRRGLSIDLVATSEANVTVSLDATANALDQATLDGVLEDLSGICTANVIRPCAAVSLVGRNIRSILHRIAPALAAFEKRSIYLLTQSASDLNLTFVTDEDQADALVPQLHGMLFGGHAQGELFGPRWSELQA